MGEFYTREQRVAARAAWRRAGRRVVFANGCYDILHPAHIRLLEKARSMGDLLILALPLEPGYSTTGIVEEILARQADTNQP